jgi:acyl-CoA hydrolase
MKGSTLLIIHHSALIIHHFFMRFVSPEEAVAVIKSGDRIFVHSVAASPQRLINAVTARGESRIVPYLKQGAGVVTTRAHVHYVATEYGVANLYGKNLRQRARALIDIAHPDHREALARAAGERFRRGVFDADSLA